MVKVQFYSLDQVETYLTTSQLQRTKQCDTIQLLVMGMPSFSFWFILAHCITFTHKNPEIGTDTCIYNLLYIGSNLLHRPFLLSAEQLIEPENNIASAGRTRRGK